MLNLKHYNRTDCVDARNLQKILLLTNQSSFRQCVCLHSRIGLIIRATVAYSLLRIRSAFVASASGGKPSGIHSGQPPASFFFEAFHHLVARFSRVFDVTGEIVERVLIPVLIDLTI